LARCERAIILRLVGVVIEADEAGGEDNACARKEPENEPRLVFAILEDVEDAGDGEQNGECGRCAFCGGAEISANFGSGSVVHCCRL